MSEPGKKKRPPENEKGGGKNLESRFPIKKGGLIARTYQPKPASRSGFVGRGFSLAWEKGRTLAF